jgi:cation-transporting ATPase E
VAKNAMSATMLIATAILGVEFPFLPRHMTIVSTLTIGLPAAILALAANRRRYVPGFLSRVLGLSLPAGVTAGLAAFFTFAFARGGPAEVSTMALATLLIVNFWLLGALARPYNWWKILVVVTMVGLAFLAFAIPVLRHYLELDLPVSHFGLPLILGAAGAAVVEVAYRISRRLHQTPDVEGHIHLQEMRTDIRTHQSDVRDVEAEAQSVERLRRGRE